MEGGADKQGKRLWAQRYLVLVGCRLLVLRYPISRKQGEQNLPLNVIDMSYAKISRKSNTVLSIQTHREAMNGAGCITASMNFGFPLRNIR